jgi:transposase InsO family protein
MIHLRCSPTRAVGRSIYVGSIAPSGRYVDGLCGRSIGRRKKISIIDGRGYLYPDSLPIESEQTLKGEDVMRALSRVKISRGVPNMVHCDNGTELSSQVMDLWAYWNGVRMAFSRPGKPTEKRAALKWFATFPAECRKAPVYQREAGCPGMAAHGARKLTAVVFGGAAAGEGSKLPPSARCRLIRLAS